MDSLNRSLLGLWLLESINGLSKDLFFTKRTPKISSPQNKFRTVAILLRITFIFCFCKILPFCILSDKQTMASEIEIICLDDSEDEEFFINKQVQSPDDWCPKIESIYSQATSDRQATLDNSHSLFYPSSSSSVEVIPGQEDKHLQFNQ